MTLLAGTGIRDIGPRKSMFLVGYPHVPRISTGIHDPLLASALCLENGTVSIILVAVDILFIDPPTARELREAIAARTQVKPQHVFISCSHTHSGPVTMEMLAWRDDPVVPKADPEYMTFFKAQIIAAAIEAVEKRQPTTLAWTSAQVEAVGENRLSPNGPLDPEASILVVKDATQDRLTALSITYCMHPTVLHEDSTLVSSDFPGYTRFHLQETFGNDLTVLYHTGPCGNQSPRHHVKAQTFPEAERLGRCLGKFVSQAVRNLKPDDFSGNVCLQGALSTVELFPGEMPTLTEAESRLADCRDTYERLKADGAPHGPVRTAECALFGAEETMVLAHAQENGELARVVEAYKYATVQALRIGNRVLIGLPCEIFVEYGLEAKKRAPCPAVVVSLVNGECQGYVVTPEAAAAGGYEAANSLFLPESGDRLVAAALSLCRILSAE